MTTEEVWHHKEEWKLGETAWFEYHCWESHDSGDAEVWYRSHQQATIIGLPEPGTDAYGLPGADYAERQEEAFTRFYTVRFADGLEWDVFEDELTTEPGDFYRPDPP